MGFPATGRSRRCLEIVDGGSKWSDNIRSIEDTEGNQNGDIFAILAGQDIIFLGERGQAKSRIIRSLTTLLDDHWPALANCEIPEDPFAPITIQGHQIIEEQGDNAELVWLSGVVAPDGTSPEEEAAATLGRMKERMAEMDISMSDVAELRVYRVAMGTDGDELAAAWNEVYGAEWNNAENNPHKPVRTNYLVDSLPGGRHVEVEAIVQVAD